MGNSHFITSDGHWVAVSDDELYHWKYIKREKVNGKWRYYYKDTKVDKARDEAVKATYVDRQKEIQAKAAIKKHNEVEEKIKSDKKAAEDRGISYIDTDEFYDNSRANADAFRAQKDAVKASISASQKARKARKNYISAKREYNKSAGHKVADFLNKSQAKIDKAKSWVSNLFSKKKKKK